MLATSRVDPSVRVRPPAFLAKGRIAWQSLACSNAFPRRASLCSALPPGSLPPAAGRSLGGAAARADATGHAGPLLQPAGRCARAASAARRVAVIGHPALAPGARPLAIHSEVRSWATWRRRAPGAAALPPRILLQRNSASGSKKQALGTLKSLKVFWGKDLGDWDAGWNKWLTSRGSLPTSVSRTQVFQSCSFSETELFWVCVLTFFFIAVLKSGHFLRSPRGLGGKRSGAEPGWRLWHLPRV